MQLINHRELRRHYDAAKRDKNERRFFIDVREALQKGQLKPEEFSVRQLFENFVNDGRELVERFDPRNVSSTDLIVLEAAGAVSTGDFSNITGQILYTRMMEEFAKPEYVWDKLCTVIPTSLNGERLPGVGTLSDDAATVGEAEPYPTAGVTEEFIDTPPTIKKGLIVPVTKEAVFFDRTGLVLQRCGDVSSTIQISREKRVLDAVFGITNTYRRNGATNNTYCDGTPYDNTQATNALVDWTDIETAELLFDAMTDPNTGEPIAIVPDTIVVPTALKNTARRIVNATEIRYGDGASNTTQTIAANPIQNSYQVVHGPYVKARTSSASTWFIGQPKKAFAYMENWGPTVTQAPPNSTAEFERDIVAAWKISERGAPAVLEPRRMVKCTG